MKRRNARRQRSGTRGGVLVEFALAALVLTPMLLGTFSFGLALRDYNNLQTAVRNAARFASLQDYDSATATPSSAYRARIVNMVLYGNPDGSGQLTAPNLNASHVRMNIVMRNNLPHQVTVSVTGFTLVDFFRPIVLTDKPSATFPYMGRFVPPV